MPVAGRFVLCHRVNGEEGYVTSWDTWEDARAAFAETYGDRIPPEFILYDDATGRVWRAGYPYEWDAAST